MANLVTTPPRALFHSEAHSPHNAKGIEEPTAAVVQERDQETHDLLGLLRRQQRARDREHQALAVSTPRAKTTFAGDRGMLSPDTSHTAPLQATQAWPVPVETSTVGPISPESQRQISEATAEVKALKEEVQSRTNEAAELRQKVRSAEQALKQASAVVSTWSTKVEAVSSSRHAVLEASAQHIDTQTGVLRERLAHKEYELSQKDKEIEILRKAVQAGTLRLEDQQGHVEGLRNRHSESMRQTAAFEDDLTRLHRQKAMDDWHQHVHSRVISHEGHDVPLALEREERKEEIAALDEELNTLRTFISNMEGKCKHYTQASAQLQQKMHDAANQERVNAAARELRQKREKERMQHHVQECKTLEARIEAEKSRKKSQAHSAKAYDSMEGDLKYRHGLLVSLVSCIREVTRTVQTPVQAGRGTVLGATHGVPEVASIRSSVPPLASPLRIGTSPMFSLA